MAILVLCDGTEALDKGRALAEALPMEAQVESLRATAAGSEAGDDARETAIALESVERLAESRRPTAAIVCGEGNGALGAALSLVKLRIPLARVGAGVRSGDRSDRVELNRLLCDRVSDLLLCPDRAAAERLAEEGLAGRAAVVGEPRDDPDPAAAAVAAWLGAYTSDE